ncbi:MAG: glycosyltransferase family 39 protein [Patescibacteria group bacterium]
MMKYLIMLPKYSRYFAVIFVFIGSVLSYTSSWNNSLIIDEISHIGAGYSYLVKGDMRINAEHPPLVKDLAAIPLLFVKLNQDAFQSPRWTTNINDQWKFGRQLIYQSGNDADLIGRLAHLPMLLFFALSAWILWKWAKKLYGDRVALFAVFLFSFSPTILANAHFATTDMAALFGVLSAAYFFVQYLQQPMRRNFWFASIFFGIALLCKFSTAMLVPLFLLTALIWNYKKIASTILLMVVGFVVVVWPLYYLHVRNYPPERQRADTFDQLQSSNHFAYAKPIIWLSDKPILRAAGQYGLGLFKVSQRWKGGTNVFFLGKVSQGAGPAYFPFVYLVKEPLAWWGLVIIAIITTIKNTTSKFKIIESLRNHPDITIMLLWLAIYWATSLKGALNVGIRHLLPIYPFMIILISGQIIKITKLKLVVYALLVWYVLENIFVFPHYLTYFNQLVGGSSGGHRYVVDSNLDWGQDLKRLGAWVRENNIRRIEFDYFGWADPSYYLGERFVSLGAKTYQNEEDFLANNTSDGWIAVSATTLMNKSNSKYAWLYSHAPTAVVGRSIFLYHLK